MARPQTTNILPGFGLATGYTVTYLGLLVILPLGAVVVMSSSRGAGGLWAVVSDERTLAAYRLSILGALGAAVVNTIFGLIVAWVIVRYRFPGRRVLDALVDLPLALPTAVAGIALTAVYSPKSWLGSSLAGLGIQVAYTNLGVMVAMILVSLPFAVRTVQPVIEDLDREVEEAAAALGASARTTFLRVLLPGLVPALLTGLTLSFAKAVGEYGSIIFISSNIPGRTEIAPLLIMTRLEEFNYPGAASVAVGLLLLSCMLLIAVNALQAWTRRRMGA
jgi:sulfate transport system permease protein